MSFRLRPEMLALAIRMQEADPLSADDVSARLRDSISDKFRGSGDWGYLVTYFGDAESGDVIYSQGSDTRRAPYTISGTGGTAAVCEIDFDASESVVPRTVYEKEADEEDSIAAMAEAFKAEELYTELPLYERFISKAERDKHGAEDFAGKGKSFPIFEPGDIQAAVKSLGRAGAKNHSISTLKNKIIAIAKAKGWAKYLPKSWQASKATAESYTAPKTGTLALKESVAFLADIPLKEAFGPSHKIKIIAPGRGSSAVYPAEVLKRDGPKVFKAGTPMRIDHPTRADEAARPEGSVRDWGAVLATDAVWLGEGEHTQGAGLYAEVKPFSDHAQLIEEKGPYAGVSIRASGNAQMKDGRVVTENGLPVLGELTSAEGVDMVTRAGAGGMFLSESVSGSGHSEVEMDKDAIALAIKEAVGQAMQPIRQEALTRAAITRAGLVLGSVALSGDQKSFVIEESIRGAIPTVAETGVLDTAKFDEVVIAEAKRIAKLVGNGAVVRGLGVPATEAGKKTKTCPECDGTGKVDGEECEECDGTGKVPIKESRRAPEDEDKALAKSLRECAALGLSEAGAERAAKGRN